MSMAFNAAMTTVGGTAMALEVETVSRKNWALLVLALVGGGALSPVQLQKSLFLIGKKMSKLMPNDFYSFEPDNYGPFCGQIYDDVRALASEGLVSVSRASGNYLQYAATEQGIARSKAICGMLPTEAVEYAKQLVRWVRAQSFRGLVSAIYREFPEYKTNSIFQE